MSHFNSEKIKFSQQSLCMYMCECMLFSDFLILTAYDTVSKTHVNFLSLLYSCRVRFSQFEDEFQIWGPCATFRDN